MSEMNSVVAVYKTHTAAEEAIKELQRSGFDMKKMSIVGKDYHTACNSQPDCDPPTHPSSNAAPRK
jgi:hypothetical protein